MLTALNITALVLLVLSSLLLVLSILLHKGQGGGMSDMFGGGLTSAMAASGVGQRNLNIATVVTSLVWLFAIILFNFTMQTPTTTHTSQDQQYSKVLQQRLQQQLQQSSAATPTPSATETATQTPAQTPAQ